MSKQSHTRNWVVGKESTETLPGNQLRRFIPIYDASHLHPEWARNEPGDHPHPIVAGVHICDEATADAHLIAAAPNLLKALEQAYEDAIRFLNEGDFKKKVEWNAGYIVDAIAKARGES